MADTDLSLYNLRYNQISQKLEGQGGTPMWNPLDLTNMTGGVSSLNTLSGAVTLAAGTNITLTPSGNTITVAASGGGGSFTPSVQSQTNTNTSVSDVTYVASTVRIAAFALASASHKVKISVSGAASCDVSSAVFLTVFVDSTTNIASNSSSNSLVFFDNSSNAVSPLAIPASFVVEYSPGDTDPHDYEVYIQNGGAGTGHFPVNANSATIIVEDVI